MPVVTLRPNLTVHDPASWVRAGGTTYHGVLADDNSATYLRSGFLTASYAEAFGVRFQALRDAVTVPAGARIAAMRLRWRVQGEGSEGSINYRAQVRKPGAPSSFTYDRTAGSTGAINTYTEAWQTTQPGTSSAWTFNALDEMTYYLAAKVPVAGPDVRGRALEAWLDVDYGLRPVVVVTAPDGVVDDTSRPVVAWTFDDPEGYPQGAYRAWVETDVPPIIGGPFPVRVWESGLVPGPVTSVQVPVDLDEGDYVAVVEGRKGWGGPDLWASTAAAWFTVELARPAAPVVVATAHDDQARVSLSIDEGVDGDRLAEWFTVEYRDHPDEPWRPLRASPVVSAILPTIVQDYEAPSRVERTYQVRALVEVDGNPIASPATLASATLEPDRDWLTDAANPSALHGAVTIHSIQRTVRGREVAHEPLGLGHSVVESEPPLQSWAIELLAATPEEHAFAEGAIASRATLLLRGAYRDVAYVRWVGDRSRTQVGPETAGVDIYAGTLVEVAPPVT